MAEPIIEGELSEAQAGSDHNPAGTEVAVHAPVAHEPVAHQSAADTHELEPEAVFGDTPLSAIERLAAPVDLSPRLRRRDRLLTAAWAASIAALAALGVAGYTQRDLLMQHWPASKRVYATLGLIPLDMKNRDAKAAPEPPAH